MRTDLCLAPALCAKHIMDLLTGRPPSWGGPSGVMLGSLAGISKNSYEVSTPEKNLTFVLGNLKTAARVPWS